MKLGGRLLNVVLLFVSFDASDALAVSEKVLLHSCTAPASPRTPGSPALVTPRPGAATRPVPDSLDPFIPDSSPAPSSSSACPWGRSLLCYPAPEPSPPGRHDHPSWKPFPVPHTGWSPAPDLSSYLIFSTPRPGYTSSPYPTPDPSTPVLTPVSSLHPDG